jgi:hypothetical protein
MKAKQFVYLSALFFAVSLSATGVSAAKGGDQGGGEQVYVQLATTKLRSETKHWASSKASLKYGDRLTVLGTKDEWLNVRSGKTSGFVHVTAVTPREIVLERSKRAIDAKANQDDIVLAGKGFGKDVEKSFLAKAGSGANIGAVNQMEKLRVSEAQLLQFIQSGKLRKD